MCWACPAALRVTLTTTPVAWPLIGVVYCSRNPLSPKGPVKLNTWCSYNVRAYTTIDRTVSAPRAVPFIAAPSSVASSARSSSHGG